MIGISWSSSWSGMNRGTRCGALGASPMLMSARPGTSSYCQAAVSWNNCDNPEIRPMRVFAPRGFPVALDGASARNWIQSRQRSRVTSVQETMPG
jgi:hypothetical protein